MLYSGIDLHKRTVVIATVDEKGKVHSEASIPTSRSAVARYFHWLPEPTTDRILQPPHDLARGTQAAPARCAAPPNRDLHGTPRRATRETPPGPVDRVPLALRDHQGVGGCGRSLLS